MAELKDEQERIIEHSAQNDSKAEQLEFQFSPLHDKQGNRLENQIQDRSDELDPTHKREVTEPSEKSLFGKVHDKFSEIGDKATVISEGVRDKALVGMVAATVAVNAVGWTEIAIHNTDSTSSTRIQQVEKDQPIASSRPPQPEFSNPDVPVSKEWHKPGEVPERPDDTESDVINVLRDRKD
jgi:hypothetical protein